MSLEWPARPSSLAWTNPVAWWWGVLTAVSGVNIAVWFLLYRQLQERPTGILGSTSCIELMLALCAAYVFGCAFRSFLPRADVQRICLFDTWLSSIAVGRSVATVAEVCFAAQWAIMLHQLGTITGVDTTVNAAWVIVPLILIAECFSWYGVVTTNYLGNAIENSIWAVTFFIVGIGICRLLPEFDGPVRVILAIAIVGIAGYLAFLMSIDVPMYLARWRAEVAEDRKFLRPLEGLRDASTRWVVTHDLAEWKDEIPWMSLYFSAAVWASLALCVCYSLENHIPRYRTPPTGALARPSQNLLDYVVVALWPVPARLELPAIDDLANEIDGVSIVTAQEVEKLVGLAASRPQLNVRDEPSSHPFRSVKFSFELENRMGHHVTFVGDLCCCRMTAGECRV